MVGEFWEIEERMDGWYKCWVDGLCSSCFAFCSRLTPMLARADGSHAFALDLVLSARFGSFSFCLGRPQGGSAFVLCSLRVCSRPRPSARLGLCLVPLGSSFALGVPLLRSTTCLAPSASVLPSVPPRSDLVSRRPSTSSCPWCHPSFCLLSSGSWHASASARAFRRVPVL